MRQNEVFPYYRKCCMEMENIYSYLKTLYTDDYVSELARYRGYINQEQLDLIAEMQLGYCDINDVSELGNMAEELGFISNNSFLLSNRFIIPVYDIAGNLVSLIGYFPDSKKYITVPTPYFSKSCILFNFRQAYELSWREYGGFVILVEGIFDCLSLRAIGLPAVATMGSSVSSIKCDLLKLFSKVLAVPDNDKTGRKALNRYSRLGWKVPSNTTFLKLSGGNITLDNGEILHCKDLDNFVSWYEKDDVREILLSYRDSHEDIEELVL